MGSPRQGQNTDTLLNTVLSAAAEVGANTERISICDLHIAGCTGCNACAYSGECIIKDDMQTVYRQLGEADVIILASPLYFMGVGGQLKLLVDRCQTPWNRRYELHLPALTPTKQRRGFFLCTGGAPNKGGRNFAGAIFTASYFFDALEAQYLGELTVADTDKSPVINNADILAEAKLIGRKLGSGEEL